MPLRIDSNNHENIKYSFILPGRCGISQAPPEAGHHARKQGGQDLDLGGGGA
jgi:hypothetical protein